MNLDERTDKINEIFSELVLKYLDYDDEPSPEMETEVIGNALGYLIVALSYGYDADVLSSTANEKFEHILKTLSKFEQSNDKG